MARKKSRQPAPFVPRSAPQLFADEMGGVLKQMRRIVKRSRAELDKQDEWLWYMRLNLVGIEQEIDAMEKELAKSVDTMGNVTADMREIGGLYAQSVRQRDALIMWMKTWGMGGSHTRSDDED